MSEIASREERESNVVISGVVESNANTSDKRQEEDRAKVLNILKHVDHRLNAEDIRVTYRTGKKRDDRARLTVVKLSSSKLRNDILKNTRGTSIPENCKIRPDLTKAEREDEISFFKRLADCKEAKPNSDFRVVGPPGHRRLMEIRKLTVPQA